MIRRDPVLLYEFTFEMHLVKGRRGAMPRLVFAPNPLSRQRLEFLGTFFPVELFYPPG